MNQYKALVSLSALIALASFFAIREVGAVLEWQAAKPSSDPLDAYPQKEGLGEVIKIHRSGKYHGRDMLVMLSWSRGGGTRNWNGWLIDDQGQGWSFRELWSYAHQGGSSGQIDPKAVESYLSNLPPSEKSPAIPDLLAVSFRRKGRWETRVYDRHHSPAKLDELCLRTMKNGLTGVARTPWSGPQND